MCARRNAMSIASARIDVIELMALVRNSALITRIIARMFIVAVYNPFTTS